MSQKEENTNVKEKENKLNMGILHTFTEGNKLNRRALKQKQQKESV